MSYCCVYRDSSSRNMVYCTFTISGFLMAMLIYSNCVCGQIPVSVIDSLVHERSVRIDQLQDTRSIDMQLFQLGFRPKAMVTTEQLENGTLRIHFPIYLIIAEEKKQRIINRLSSTYTYLISIEIDTESQEIILNIPTESAFARIDELVNHFGYEGHE